MTEPEPVANPLGAVLRMLGHTTLVLFLLTFGYYLLPLRAPWGDSEDAARLGGSVVAFIGVVVLLYLQLRRGRTQPPAWRRAQWLLTALYLLILVFALTYVVVATVSPDQFVGITDRTTALYYTVTVMATVGFGDIYAAGTFARALVTVQMLFNLIYLGTALRMLSTLRPPGSTDD